MDVYSHEPIITWCIINVAERGSLIYNNFMSLTIGKQLQSARQAKNLSLKNVAEATHIRSSFIQLLEDDNFEAFPSAAQARGFLNIYTEFLGLKVEDLISLQHGTNPPFTDAQNSPARETTSEFINSVTTSHGSEFITNLESHPINSAGEQTILLDPLIDKSEDVSGNNIASDPKPGVDVPEIKDTEYEPARTIFVSIGQELSGRRELLGMSLEEIERHIHVRKHYLEIIESGDFHKLPSSVQARGMINNYANFLDMDAENLLLRFADGLQIQRQEKILSRNPHEKPPHRSIIQRGIRRYISVDMMLGGGLIIVLLIFAVWGTNKIISTQNIPTAESTAPSISEILLNTPTAGNLPATEIPEVSPVVLPSAIEQTKSAALPTGSTGNIQLIIVAMERALVVVTVDGVVKFNGRVVPDTAYPFDAKRQIEVLTSNGAAIKITYNGTDLGVMGSFGQVIDLIYTSNAIITPTFTSTPTATHSPIPSSTPVPSATPRPSSTSPSTPPKTP
jgi:cytoskeleton protein RodZ